MGESDRREALEVLEAIAGSLRAIESMMRALVPKPVASDAELDGKWGDPILRFTPRGWQGDEHRGRTFSQLPVDLLDLVAESCDYFAEQAEAKKEMSASGKPVAPYKRADAARARGWARRLRAGWKPPPFAAQESPPDDFDQTGPAGGWGEDPFA